MRCCLCCLNNLQLFFMKHYKSTCDSGNSYEAKPRNSLSHPLIIDTIEHFALMGMLPTRIKCDRTSSIQTKHQSFSMHGKEFYRRACSISKIRHASTVFESPSI
mmetsp:Transcript_28253/g.58774  ORF Transcript_28253/g.58774 Transcript_28253/m.58774 type:complete len:104 (+) Transcript_28253:325-636(+)